MQDDKPGDAKTTDNERGHFDDVVTVKWLSKCVGREVEIYTNRAPKAHGILRAVDERFGRCIIETDTEEVLVWLGQILQIRMPRENGHSKRGGASR